MPRYAANASRSAMPRGPSDGDVDGTGALVCGSFDLLGLHPAPIRTDATRRTPTAWRANMRVPPKSTELWRACIALVQCLHAHTMAGHPLGRRYRVQEAPPPFDRCINWCGRDMHIGNCS